MIDIGKICRGGDRLPASILRNDMYKMKNVEGLSVSSVISGDDLNARSANVLFFLGNQRQISFLFMRYCYTEEGDYNATCDETVISVDSLVIKDLDNVTLSFTEIDKQSSKNTIIKDGLSFTIMSKIITLELANGAPELLQITNIRDDLSNEVTFDTNTSVWIMQNNNTKTTIVPPYLNNVFNASLDFIINQQNLDLRHQANFFSCGTKDLERLSVRNYDTGYILNNFCFTSKFPIMFYFISSSSDVTVIQILADVEILDHTVTSTASGYLHSIKLNVIKNGSWVIIFDAGKTLPTMALLTMPNWEARHKDTIYWTNRSRIGKISSNSSDDSYTNFHANLINNMANTPFYNDNFRGTRVFNDTAYKGCVNVGGDPFFMMSPVNYSTIFKGKMLESENFNCDFGF